jgi:hypothetical protein
MGSVARAGLCVPFLDFEEHLSMLRRSDDAFDSMVCALLARTVELGLTIDPGSGATSAESEGWIHLPVEGSLQLLSVSARFSLLWRTPVRPWLDAIPHLGEIPNPYSPLPRHRTWFPTGSIRRQRIS